MALKELVADANQLTEKAIEGIVAPYVHYDPSSYSVVFTPSGASLANVQKVLVYVVALLGWKYVVDEVQPVHTKPADLESALGISGGTLRPILKKLKDNHLITAQDGHYNAQPANMDAISQIVSGAKVLSQGQGKSRSKTAAKTAKVSGGHVSETDDNKKKPKSSAGALRSTLEKLIEDGFFDQSKTIGELQSRFHESAIIVKQTSLSGLLLRGVQDGLLKRKKMDVEGKHLWTYFKS